MELRLFMHFTAVPNQVPHLNTSGRWSYSTCVPHTLSRQRVARPRSTRYSRFSLGLAGCPSRKFSGFTSPCTYLTRQATH